MLLLGLLLAASLGLLVSHGPPPVQPAAPAPTFTERLSEIDVLRAADVLSSQVAARRLELGAALFAGDEAALADLLRLQAEAAQLTLDPIQLRPQAREGLLRTVDAELTVHGAYYDIPIFVDGLYRQRHVALVRRITLEARQPMAALVDCRLELLFFRPVDAPVAYLNQTTSQAELDVVSRGFASAALADAARLVAYHDFEDRVPELQQRSKANQRLVLRTIPRLVKKLPSSPMDWIGATFDGEQVHLTSEALQDKNGPQR